jgi:hypothetical protein
MEIHPFPGGAGISGLQMFYVYWCMGTSLYNEFDSLATSLSWPHRLAIRNNYFEGSGKLFDSSGW